MPRPMKQPDDIRFRYEPDGRIIIHKAGHAAACQRKVGEVRMNGDDNSHFRIAIKQGGDITWGIEPTGDLEAMLDRIRSTYISMAESGFFE